MSLITSNEVKSFLETATTQTASRMKAIAEGVEMPHQVTHLSRLGCEAAQGYFFSKPLNLQLAESIIATNPQW